MTTGRSIVVHGVVGSIPTGLTNKTKAHAKKPGEAPGKVQSNTAQGGLLANKADGAQKCLDEYRRNKKKATTPGEKVHYALLYVICLSQGFNISFPISLP